MTPKSFTKIYKTNVTECGLISRERGIPSFLSSKGNIYSKLIGTPNQILYFRKMHPYLLRIKDPPPLPLTLR